MSVAFRLEKEGVQVFSIYNINLKKKMRFLHFGCLVVAALLLFTCNSISSTAPVWVSSSFFKAGAVTFVFTSSSVTSQNTTVVYTSPMTSTSLKVPCLGITDLSYKVQTGAIQLLVSIVQYTTTFLKFETKVNANSRLNTLKLTYMAIDNSFTPAFSMNYFFPHVSHNGSGWSAQYYVNFTASTGVTLNTTHDNALLPFLHYIDCVSYDTTVDIQLSFSLVNGSFYTVIISTTSNIYINYAGFSRIIFDKTAIQALGNDYFNYGIVSSTNDNAAQLQVTIPPDIIPENLFYGLHSLMLTSANSWIDYGSNYTVNTGLLELIPQGSYTYASMKYSYMHHKTRTCPVTHPYYNISEMLCYDQCAVMWYANIPTSTCEKCLYDCYTCTNATACTSCESPTMHRTLSMNRCPAQSGYYDTGVNDPVAAPCTSPCASCVTTATYCLSCVTGYYLNGSSCLSCSAAITNCTQCTNSSFCILCNDGSNGTSCTTCTSSQYKSGGVCYACSSAITNCASCTSNTACTLCQNTFTLFSPTNCSCNSSQYISGGTCLACSSSISYCSSCSDASTCTSCQNTFTLLSATNCGCNTTTFFNTTTSQCESCTQVTSYCLSCTSTTCSSCMNNFTLSSSSCICSSGYYANSTTEYCQSCSVISHCLACNDVNTCTSCDTGYKVNLTSGLCDVQPCTVSNCDTCIANSTTFCQGCYTGYSITVSGGCTSFCGNGALDATEQCDDGNSVSDDGCSSSCTVQSGFSCHDQYVNSSNTYSACFYTSTISFTHVWTRKYQGNNSLKFQFKLNQQIKQWKSVDFSSILSINQVDSSTKMSTGMINQMIQNINVGYIESSNRFWVIFDYINYSMENTYLCFELAPYAHNAYPAFTVPNSIEYVPQSILTYLTVSANNNQNANLYSDYMYQLYSFSVVITYIVVGMAIFAVLVSLVFRTGTVITFEMITVMQITYFSIASLDSINPVFSGLLPLRYLAGILTFQNVQDYLEQTTSPNAMKGIYMFLNLSSNFSWAAVGFGCFIGFGVLLLTIYLLVDYCSNPDTLQHDAKPANERNGYCFYRLAFHFIGQLSLSLIFYCLPLFTISLFFQALYTQHNSNLWSYAQGVGVGIAIICYFVALFKSDHPKQNQSSKLGEYLSEYSKIGCFQTFKYCNWMLIECLIISGLVVATIYSDNKIFSAFCIITICVIDIVVVAVVKPYHFGFVSCFKGEDNDTEVLFQKIQLYKVYEQEPPTVIRIDYPDLTQKSQENQNNSQVFAQHFATRKNMIKSRHQGLVQAGQTLRQTKLILFNNNTRRIVDLATLVAVQFIFISTKIYQSSINKNFDGPSIQALLPLIIHIVLFLNVVYNYFMLFLQILNRTRDSIAKVDVEPDSSIQFNKSLYTQNSKAAEKENGSDALQNTTQTNKLIIKSNGTAVSMYDLKRPQIIKGHRKQKKKQKTNKIIQEQ